MPKKSNKNKSENPNPRGCVWDFTLFDIEKNENEIRDSLTKECKKYAFQLEEGKETKKLHYQGRFSLKQKTYKRDVIRLLKDKWNSFHISITSEENRTNFFYVMKEDTRVKGPWTDENNIFISDEIKDIILYPWQESLKKELLQYNARVIDYLYDPKGNKGKSTFCEYMETYHNAKELPLCNDSKDIMRMAYCIGEKPIYLIDMPRAIGKERLFQFWGAIEKLKGGFCYDDRYSYKDKRFKKPRICVFSNKLPDESLLSSDRWCIWTITERNTLRKYDPHDEDVTYIDEDNKGVSIEIPNEEPIDENFKFHNTLKEKLEIFHKILEEIK